MTDITIRAGTYHNGIFHEDNTRLFDVLRDSYLKDIRVSGLKDSYFYFLNSVRISENELVGELSRARRSKAVKTVSDSSNEIEVDTNRNLVDCTIRFYMDMDNTIVLEEKNRIPRFRFVWALSQIVYEYNERYGRENHRRIYGHELTVTFDRYNAKSPDQFLDELKTLRKIEVKVNSWQNPFMNKKMESLQKQFLDMKANKAVITGSDLDKNSEMVRATTNLSTDGHLDVKMEGDDEGGERVTFTSDKNQDDQYVIKGYHDDSGKFREAIDVIIRMVRRNHGKS